MNKRNIKSELRAIFNIQNDSYAEFFEVYDGIVASFLTNLKTRERVMEWVIENDLKSHQFGSNVYIKDNSSLLMQLETIKMTDRMMRKLRVHILGVEEFIAIEPYLEGLRLLKEHLISQPTSKN